MRWSDLLRMSVSSLRRRKLRTFLTVLGVVIGTASIVVMISLGLGLQESMYKEVEQNGGTTSITVTGKDSGGMMYGYSGMSSDEEESQKYITDDVIKELKNVAHVKSAEPILSISVIALKGKYEGFIELTGMTPEGLKTLNLELEDGGRLPDPNSAQLELVYGNTVITNFYEKTSGRGYWDSGELPDIDLQTDSVFLILDQDGYYQSQSAASDIGGSAGESGEGGTASAKTPPKKHVVSASGVLKGGPVDEATSRLVEKGFLELEKVSALRSVFRIFEMNRIDEEKVAIGTLQISSKSLARNLNHCEKAVLFGATLGTGVDRLIARTSLTDMANAVVLQACAAAMLEEFCDEKQFEIGEELEKEGLYLRPRFSPGYGDFDIGFQKSFMQMLDCAKAIGLTMTESFMMTPTKSVTAVIGASRIKERCPIAGCEVCDKKECIYRR